MVRHRLGSAVAALVAALCAPVLAQSPLGGPAGQAGRDQKADRTSNVKRAGTRKDVIDFEDLAPGTIVDQVYGASGVGPVLVNGQSPGLPFAPNVAIVFDSSFPTGGDPDLGSPNVDFGGPGLGASGSAGSPFQNDTALGKLLIVAENLWDANGDLLVDDPDDADLEGAWIELDFSAVAPVEIREVTLIDTEQDRPPSQVELFDGAGNTLALIELVQPGDNGVFTQSLGPTSGVHRMVIWVNGSGGYDNLVFSTQGDCDDDGIPDRSEPDCDADGIPDDCETDCNANGEPDDCEQGPDCNANGIPDECEPDCDADGIPDDCEPDCNANGEPDDCEQGPDCNGNGIPDECEPDCDADGVPDACETDCNGNGIPDDCETGPDCNGNGVPDECDVDAGTSGDVNDNGIPDECEPDCDDDGIPDDAETDCDGDGIPDDCEPDCDGDGLPDDCEEDCNANGTPDDCETGPDCNGNGIPDECEADCDADGTPDDCESDCDADGLPDDCQSFPDCNGNGLPDACDVASGDSDDDNGNGIPDECEADCDDDGIPDDAEADCDGDGIPDDCEPDCDGNGVPDDCEPDCDGDGVPDACDMDGDGGVCVEAAVPDPTYSSSSYSHAFWIPVIATDFVFVSGGELVEQADGTARLTGVIQSASDPGERMLVDVAFTGRVNPGQVGYPPAGSPRKELFPSAYVENGGPVDASTWYYYETTDGILLGEDDLAGAVLRITRRGPSFQVGFGANNKNLAYGASGWFDVETLAQPHVGSLPATYDGDINVDVVPCVAPDASIDRCASAAAADPGAGGSGGGHVVIVFSLGRFVFADGGRFVEHADGTADLFGEVVHESDASRRFWLATRFADRVDPGDASHPPAGSPHLELAASAYASNGGPIDPATWRYYTSTTGVLVGHDAYDGAVVSIERRGPSFQVGEGASGKNLLFGASGWIDTELLAQSTGGTSLPWDTGDGDFNFDVLDCAPDCPLDCGFCAGGVDALSLRYDGDSAALVAIDQTDGTNVFLGLVAPGEVIDVTGTGPGGTFGAGLELLVDGVEDGAIDTSCGAPVGPNLVAGSFTVVGGTSDDGGALCPVYGTTDVVAHWAFEETGGTVAHDDAGDHHGTLMGGASPGSSGADGGRAVRFDGNNDCVEVAHADDLLLDAGTVSFWFRADAIGGEQGLFSKDSNGYDDGGHLSIFLDGSRLRVRLQSAGASHWVETGYGLAQQVWYHVDLRFGPGGMELRLDDVLVDTNGWAGGLGASSGGSGNREPIVLGASSMESGDQTGGPLTDFFDGKIDELTIRRTGTN